MALDLLVDISLAFLLAIAHAAFSEASDSRKIGSNRYQLILKLSIAL